jgi:hypothetical protein
MPPDPSPAYSPNRVPASTHPLPNQARSCFRTPSPAPPMAMLVDALRQAFLMPRRAYAALRDDEGRALPRLRRPLAGVAAVCAAVAVAACVSLGIVFPAEPAERPFCRERRMLEALPAGASSREEPEAYRYRGGAFYMTTAEAADFYWMVVFVPTSILFGASFTYLLARETAACIYL